MPRKNSRRPVKGGPTYNFAPPDVEAVHFTGRRPKAPFPGAERWQESVYYLWWEYMKRHEGYLSACRSRGRGEFASLYEDFGDIRRVDFQKWFAKRGPALFAEPQMDRAKLVTVDEIKDLNDDWLIIAIPKKRKQRSALRHVRELLAKHNPTPTLKERESNASYQVVGQPHLEALYTSLMVYDAYHNKRQSLVDVGYAVGLAANFDEAYEKRQKDEIITRAEFKSLYNRRLRTVVSRHYRLAKQYIENLPTKEFPVRKSR